MHQQYWSGKHLDNVFSDQHKVCFDNDLGHENDQELGTKEGEGAEKEYFVTNSNKREY